jgi:hypothetical protein
VERLAFPIYASGRAQTARRWFQWFEDRGLIGRYSLIALQGAFLQVLAGEPDDIERWAALLCRDGVDRMGADAEAAVAGLAREARGRRPPCW